MQLPDVSVVLAVHDGERYLRLAVEGVLRQTHHDLELVVVDDASTDGSGRYLAEVRDNRLRVVRNERRLGLAESLNVGLRTARARYVARMDADDVPFPEWLERLRRRADASPTLTVLGSAMLDIDEAGRPSRIHRLPLSVRALRWHALFTSPFFHSTVLVDSEVLERNGLAYDTSRPESEDYDLWSRLLTVADGANVPEPLVMHRVHPRQASARRQALQVQHQREIALRQIGALAPELRDAELAWAVGAGRPVAEEERRRAGEAFGDLYRAFARRFGEDPELDTLAAASLARAGLLRRALALEPRLPIAVARRRLDREHEERRARPRAARWLRALAGEGATRVTVVSPEPTPYRAPLFDRIAQRLDLTVVYAARSVAGRTWSVAPTHDSVFLRGLRVPGARRLLRHEYPITPEIFDVLRETRPDVVVISGWSTFAAQIAVAWCRARSTPFILLVESHDLGPRSAWRRAVKGAVVPWIVRGAESVLVVGTLARESVVARGADPERVRVFANTIDVDAWADRVEALRPPGVDGEVVVLSVGRLAAEKGFDALIRAVAAAGDPRLRVGIAGEGVERERLAALAAELAVPLELSGDLSSDELLAAYASADVFALLSTHEPWGVVVNEAAASALPLVLSDRVGAACDLLRDGENGFLVPAGDEEAAARALRVLLDPAERRRAGARSRELVREWGYEPSVEAFVDAVREAAASR